MLDKVVEVKMKGAVKWAAVVYMIMAGLTTIALPILVVTSTMMALGTIKP